MIASPLKEKKNSQSVNMVMEHGLSSIADRSSIFATTKLSPTSTREAKETSLFSRVTQAAGTKRNKSTGAAEDNGPAWAPLHDSYMLTNSKLKNWDKMAVTTTADGTRVMHSDSSSDED